MFDLSKIDFERPASDKDEQSSNSSDRSITMDGRHIRAWNTLASFQNHSEKLVHNPQMFKVGDKIFYTFQEYQRLNNQTRPT